MSCSLHDAVRLEERGTPTAAIGTAPFRPEAEEQVRLLGMPDYRMVELPHPIQPLPAGAVADLADEHLEQIVSRLLGP